MNEEAMSVPKECDIRSPAELEFLLRQLSRLIEAGALRQCELAGSSQMALDLRKLPPGGPWPDIVEAEFVDAEGRRCHLFVDTFHGAGGQWRILG
jgi:hypothetical protein